MTRVVFVGEMYNADLSIGGGPIIPAPQPPLGIWGPTDPRPTHPIAGYPWPTPPAGPVDPGYSPPWARPPVDPGYSPPWARPQPPYVDNTLPGSQPRPDQGLPPFATQLPVWPGQAPQPPLGIWGGPWLPPYVDNTLPIIPPQQPIIDPINPGQAHLVAYTPKAGGGYERTTFTVQMPEPSTPTEPAPKA